MKPLSPEVGYAAALPTHPRDVSRCWNVSAIAVLGTLLALTIAAYVRTLTPSLLYGDSAEFQVLAATLGWTHATGYPVYLLLGKLFTILPVGDVAYRVNLLSAVCGAIAVAGAYAILIELLRSHVGAILGALSLAISYTFWSQAVVAEVYTPNAACLTALIWLLVRWQRTGRTGYLWSFSLLYPLSGAMHATSALCAPGFLFFILARPHWLWRHHREALITVLCLLAGALIVLELFFLMDRLPGRPDWIHSSLITAPDSFGLDPSDLDSFPERLTFVAGGRQFHGVMFSQPAQVVQRNIRGYWQRLPDEFAGPALTMAALGAVALFITNWRAAVALALVFAANLCFDVNYDIKDIRVFFIPTYVVVALGIGAGLSGLDRGIGWLAGWIAQRSRLHLGMALHSVLAGLVTIPLFFSMVYVPFVEGRWRSVQRGYPYFAVDGYVIPAHGLEPKMSATRFISQIEDNAIVFTDWGFLYPLYYIRYIEQGKWDMDFYETYPMAPIRGFSRLRLQMIDRVWDQRPVYFTQDVPEVLARYQIRRLPNCYQIVGRR
jgi:hypothetical protein